MCDSKDVLSLTPESWLGNASTTSKCRFVVPVYQRLFTWGKPQFDRLLDDLIEWYNKDSDESYNLGIITVVEEYTVIEEGTVVKKDTVIDGQQRLTVITLLAGMLGWKGSADVPCSFLDYEARPDDRKSLKLIWEKGQSWLSYQDRRRLESDLADISSESMREFVLHICDHKDKWVKLGEKLKEHLTLLVSLLPKNYSKHIELQNEYFEKMNSAGRQLEPHEILKVMICKGSNDFKKWNAVEDFTKGYEKKDGDGDVAPVSIESIIGASKQKDPKTQKVTMITVTDSARGRTNVPLREGERKSCFEKWRPALIDFPMFLLHVLKLCEQGNSFVIPGDSHNLLKHFNESNLSKDEKTGDFVDNMVKYRQFLDEWIIHKNVDSTELGESTNDPNCDENDSCFSYWNTETRQESVWLSPYADQSDADKLEEGLKVRLKQVQMALFAIGGQNQEWLYDAFNKLYKKEEAPKTTKEIPKKLYNILYEEMVALSHLSELANQARTDYLLRYKVATPAQFVCLDYFLWLLANSNLDSDTRLKKKVFCREGSNHDDIPEAIVKFVPRSNRSVEHFHPQYDNNNSSCHTGKKEDANPEADGWGAIIGVPNDDVPHISIKDMFGNLALISAGRNSEYSNFSVNEKSARIKKRLERKSLESIKLWLMAKSCNFSDEQWTPTVARNHANLMFEVIEWGLKQV